MLEAFCVLLHDRWDINHTVDLITHMVDRAPVLELQHAASWTGTIRTRGKLSPFSFGAATRCITQLDYLTPVPLYTSYQLDIYIYCIDYN